MDRLISTKPLAIKNAVKDLSYQTAFKRYFFWGFSSLLKKK